jgi:CheY-like chemotaxis protein
MGGDATARSIAGAGSTFTLAIQTKASPADQTQSIQSSSPSMMSAPKRSCLRGAKILLTDDNAINRQVIKLFLAPQGCQIVEACNGREALDKLGRQPFDLVLLDVHMPVMDGKETIRQIRGSTEIWHDIPTIALTADAMLGDRELLLALGMTDYLPKPIDQRELISKVQTLLQFDDACETSQRAATG